jgi:hypothetical protein
MQGKSLVPLLEDPVAPFREDFFYEHLYPHFEGYEHIERTEGIRTGNWSYINYIDQKGPLSEELYYIPDDPLQMNDLSSDQDAQSTLLKMRERHRQFFEK